MAEIDKELVNIIRERKKSQIAPSGKVDQKLVEKVRRKTKPQKVRFPIPKPKTDVGRLLTEFGVGVAQAGGLGFPGLIAEKISPGAREIIRTPSEVKAERVARGVGTVTGFAALLPRLILKAGVAGAGALATRAGIGGLGLAAAKGAGGLALLETLKAPENELKEKLLTVPLAGGIGAIGGAVGAAASPVIKRVFGGDARAYRNWLKNPKVSPTSKELILSKIDPVNKIIRALNEAKPLRGAQERLFTEARKKLTADIARIGKETPGEKGFIRQLSALKGELPKLQFKGIRTGVSQFDIDNLFSMVENSSKLLPFEKITAKSGLMKLLGAEGGVLPTKGQLRFLNDVFGGEFTKTVLAKRTLLQKAGEAGVEVLNVPRALMASFDLSAPFRQGAFLIGRPKQFSPAFRDMFKFFRSDKAYQGLVTELRQRPNFPLMQQHKLLTEIGGDILQREEAFMSSLAEKLPVVGRVVKASNRAFTGFLNKLRADVFDDLINKARFSGLKVEGRVSKDLARFISSATGRGTLPQVLDGSRVVLNTFFFSPRLVASRINLLNPVFYAKLEPFARKEALKSLLTATGVATTVLGLAKMGGAEVSTDPRNADFGKIKVGNTRFDILAGFQQPIRLGAQLITGEHISSTTGVKTVTGEGFKPLTRAEILQRFIENKEAPVASFVTSALKGRTPIGEEFEFTQEVINRVTPMVLQDLFDLIEERGALEGIGMALPAFFGVGVQTYAPTAEDMVRAKNSVNRSVNQLMKQGRIDEARKLFKRNRKQFKMGEVLEPIQKDINKLLKAKDDVTKNIRILPERKKKLFALIEVKRKRLEKQRDLRFEQLKSRKK